MCSFIRRLFGRKKRVEPPSVGRQPDAPDPPASPPPPPEDQPLTPDSEGQNPSRSLCALPPPPEDQPLTPDPPPAEPVVPPGEEPSYDDAPLHGYTQYKE